MRQGYKITVKEAGQAKIKLDSIKLSLRLGKLTYNEAKNESEKPLEILSLYMQQRAKAYDLKVGKIGFSGFMR